jgi:putative addiction module component (TIGR02574 family)
MSDILRLPQSERLALAIALWDSLDDEARDGALPLDSALCPELDRRWYGKREPALAQDVAEMVAAAVERIRHNPQSFPLIHGHRNGSAGG